MQSLFTFLFWFAIGFLSLWILWGSSLKKHKFQWANDSWFTIDKMHHFVGGVILGLCFGWPASLINVLWELKDGFNSYQFYGKWGGDGFSWKDYFCTQLGITLAIPFYMMLF